ncbi:hypothetical protein pdam_00004039 [Pocillopora damicornis]|uniref:G-protein coupled receptors family 1 profile domain-containing protein n=1 Tax=Pocillopora damicornis TaxID=46731 RepID=A0A3M6UC14_POCDA|nr:hypothetical protein pdam_00004039 [Pocillopora damicornis]
MNWSNTTIPSPASTRAHPWFVVFCVEAFIVVCGNLITILAFVSSKSSRKTYLGEEMSFWNIHWGLALDITLFGLDVLLGFASLTTLTVISLERVYAALVPVVLHYGNSFVNPLVYSLRMPEFRSSVVRIFCTSYRQRKGAASCQRSVTEDVQSTSRSPRCKTQKDELSTPTKSKNTTVTWRKGNPQEVSVLLTDLGDTEKF